MDIKECYRKMGGNFDDVMQRLGNESFIQRFVIRFLDDPSFQMIKDGIEKKDAELAFRGGTYIKGCMLKSWIFKIVRFKFTADGDFTWKRIGGL